MAIFKNKVFLNYKIIFILLFDVAASIFSWIFSYLLRYNFNIPSENISPLINAIPIICVVNFLVFYLYKVSRATWRFISIENLRDLIYAVVSSTLIITLIGFMLQWFIPRSVLIIYPALLVIILGGSRFLFRYIKESNYKKTKDTSINRIVVYGAGSAGANLIRSFKRSNKWEIVAFLDDDEAKHNRDLYNIRVIGGLSKLKIINSKYGVNKIVIAIPSISSHLKKRILKEAGHYKLEILTIPSVDDLISGRISISEIRPILIEEVLGREQVNIDNAGIKTLISNRVVLVSGAGGSIGSELCRQILRFNPIMLICVDISEIALYKIEQEFLNLKSNTAKYIVADVKNKNRITQIFNQFKPEIVFHAAAYKHVPLMEIYNVSEVLINNVIGTYILGKISKTFDVKKFILVSTDKAINPANIMGASKYLAEKICRGLSNKSPTEFIITRFGNVLGSSGSVIPKFREQITLGGPITVTHPKITRYFMSIPEAAQLVMQACFMAKGGEIFILDMGAPIKILDLAKQMIKLSGFNKNEIKIKFSGLRPGEKLFEELLADNELTVSTPHPKIKVAFSEAISEKLLKDIIKWVLTTTSKTEVQIKKELKRWVKGYSVNDKRTGPTKA